MTKVDYNTDKIIEQPYLLKHLKFDGIHTKTTHFLVPGLHIVNNSSDFSKYFANAFINDEGIIHIVKNPVFLLFKTKTFDERWKVFEAEIRKSPRCIYDYDVGKYDDDNLVMFIYEFPKIYKEDYDRFLLGEYSKFSEAYRKLFPEYKMVNGKKLENTLYGVINKTEGLKKTLEKYIGTTIDSSGEYWEKYSPEREIFRKK